MTFPRWKVKLCQMSDNHLAQVVREWREAQSREETAPEYLDGVAGRLERRAKEMGVHPDTLREWEMVEAAGPILDERTTVNSLHRLAHLLDESVPTPNEADKPS